MTNTKTIEQTEGLGRVYCYMCTHVVEATVVKAGKQVWTKPGQSCQRCKASIDAGSVLELQKAA